MRIHLGLGLFAFTLTELVAPGLAEAATANCMSPDGACEVSNDAGDWIMCSCADGSGGGGGGGNEWDGLTEMELEPICDQQLAMFCAGGPPPPPPGIPCGTASGACLISNMPFDSLECTCADGSAFGYGGGNAWAGLDEMELVGVCEDIVDIECAGGPPPPPPGLECTSPVGACSISNDPEDFIECACVDGTGFGGGGGMTWAGLSDEELLMVCETQLEDGCGEGETSETDGTTPGESGESGESGNPGDTGGTGGGTGGEASTGGVESSGGGEGLDTGGEAEAGSTSSEPGEGSTSGGGGDATEGATEGGGGGGSDGGNSGGCSVGSAQAPGWALVLLGMLGLGRRRRRAA